MKFRSQNFRGGSPFLKPIWIELILREHRLVGSRALDCGR